jgi:hypothetical protein
MPMSAYVQSVVFLVLGAAALFGGAGTLAIPAFWIYLAILAAIMIASLAWLDPDLARERMRPGGQKPPIALRLFAFVLVAHWLIAGLDRGRFHWSDDVPLWLRVLGFIALAAGYVLCFWAMRVNRFFSHPIRPRPARDRQRALCRCPASGLHLWHPGHARQRACAVLVDRLGVSCGLQRAVPDVSGHYRRPRAAGRAAGLSRLCRACALAACTRRVVNCVWPEKRGS